VSPPDARRNGARDVTNDSSRNRFRLSARVRFIENMSMILESIFRPLGIVAALVLTSSAIGADWNQWRGPKRDGVASDFKVPAKWTAESLQKKWTVPVGEGHASPVVVGEYVYIFAREDEKEIMRCLAIGDGKIVWQDAYSAPYEMNPAARGHGKGPKATPVVANGRVFALGINGHLSAYDAKSGAVLWRKDFARDFKTTAPVFGTAASPIVEGNNVIAHVGGENNGALMAFDAAKGNVVWKWDADGPAYASPVIGTFGGVRQLITQSQDHCLAVSPNDGKLLWKIPFKTPYDQNSVTPTIAGDLVIFAGLQKPIFAVKPSATEGPSVWEANEITMYMSSPVLSGTTLYGMSNKQRGSLFALNASTGAVLWRGEGRLGENVSMTDVGPAFLVVTDGGELSVQQKTGDTLKEIIKYKVAETPVWASPAVAGNQILIKDKTTLTLYNVVDGN
jgi:outer membrane protein assembly factor BamB